MKDKLIKGQAFIGLDDNKYYFLGLDYDEQVLFTTLDLWTEKEQKYMEKSNLFIKEVLNEKSDLIEDCTWYFQSMQELESSSTEEKIKRCLDIIKNSNNDDIELKPISVGPLVEGQAFSYDHNQYYKVIGFIVDNEIYVDNDFKTRQKGFFAIYHSNCNDNCPLIFERSFSEQDNSFNGRFFLAGNDDKVDIKSIILSKDLVDSSMTTELKSKLKNNNHSEKSK